MPRRSKTQSKSSEELQASGPASPSATTTTPHALDNNSEKDNFKKTQEKEGASSDLMSKKMKQSQQQPPGSSEFSSQKCEEPSEHLRQPPTASSVSQVSTGFISKNAILEGEDVAEAACKCKAPPVVTTTDGDLIDPDHQNSGTSSRNDNDDADIPVTLKDSTMSSVASKGDTAAATSTSAAADKAPSSDISTACNNEETLISPEAITSDIHDTTVITPVRRNASSAEIDTAGGSNACAVDEINHSSDPAVSASFAPVHPPVADPSVPVTRPPFPPPHESASTTTTATTITTESPLPTSGGGGPSKATGKPVSGTGPTDAEKPVSGSGPTDRFLKDMCEVCGKHCKAACTSCNEVKYCSKDCQRIDWNAGHKRTCNKNNPTARPYKFREPDIYNLDYPWHVEEILNGPDQPLDPPDTEDYEYALELWRDREFRVSGEVRFTASLIPPDIKELIQEGLRKKRINWPLLMEGGFIRILTEALLPLPQMRVVVEQLIASDRKINAGALSVILIEHWWRVKAMHGYDTHDPLAASLLQKYNILLPFSCTGKNIDEFRDLTHYRFTPGPPCGCYSCQEKLHWWDKTEEIWERLRFREAKRGIFIMPWRMKVELEEKEQNKHLWSIDDTPASDLLCANAQAAAEGGTLPNSNSRAAKSATKQAVVGTKAVASKWSYKPDEERADNPFSMIKMAEEMRILDVAYKQKRILTMEELDTIVRGCSIPKDRYLAESERVAKVKKLEREKLAQRKLIGACAVSAAAKATASTPASGRSASSSPLSSILPSSANVSLSATATVGQRGPSRLCKTAAASSSSTTPGKNKSYTSRDSDDNDEDEDNEEERENIPVNRRGRGSSGLLTADAEFYNNERPVRRAAARKAVSYAEHSSDSEEETRRRRRHSEHHSSKEGKGGRKNMKGRRSSASTGHDDECSGSDSGSGGDSGSNYEDDEEDGSLNLSSSDDSESDFASDNSDDNNSDEEDESDGEGAKRRRSKSKPRQRHPKRSSSNRASTGGSSDSRRVAKAEAEANPERKQRTILLGPVNGESVYEFKRRMLIRYKELHGDMLVPQSFVVPWTDDWPEETWGHRLGKAVDNIRQGHNHKDMRADLISIGFVFEKQQNICKQIALGWDRICAALLHYKHLNGHLRVPCSFIVPDDDDNDTEGWPAGTRGIRLGSIIRDIRSGKSHKDRRQELLDMGFEFKLKR